MPFLFLSMSLFSLCLFPFLFPNISLFGWKSSTIKEAGLVVMQLGQTSKNKLNWITCKRIKRIAILAKDLGSKKSQFLQKILDQKESTEKFLASRYLLARNLDQKNKLKMTVLFTCDSSKEPKCGHNPVLIWIHIYFCKSLIIIWIHIYFCQILIDMDLNPAISLWLTRHYAVARLPKAACWIQSQ